MMLGGVDSFFTLFDFLAWKNLKKKNQKSWILTNFGGRGGFIWPFLLKKFKKICEYKDVWIPKQTYSQL